MTALALGQLAPLWGEPASAPLGWSGRVPTAILTDSRQLQPGALFVPLVGERFDGHCFVEQAITAGAASLVADPHRLPGPAAAEALLTLAEQHGCVVWWVPDTLEAYQQLACLWREALAIPVVAVTGSAGKTTTRELIRAVLKPLGPVLASSGNENNDIGVPLTLLKATAADRAVVVEMGMRGLGEIERLSRCAKPSVAVITNIGSAHIGRLGSRQAIATAKCEITSALDPGGVVVIPAGDPLLEQALGSVWQGRVIRVALADDALAAQTPPPTLTAQFNGNLLLKDGAQVPLPLPGRHNARNLLLAMAVAGELGLSADALAGLDVEVPGGRNRRLQVGQLTVLDETYNASPEAVLAALELLACEPGRRFAVLGTMLELGEQSESLHRRVAARAAELNLDGLVIVASGVEGRSMEEEAAALPRLQRVESPEQAVEPLRQWLQAGDVVLLKASRGVALERLIPLLELPQP